MEIKLKEIVYSSSTETEVQMCGQNEAKTT
jgi:hypothetical protein